MIIITIFLLTVPLGATSLVNHVEERQQCKQCGQLDSGNCETVQYCTNQCGFIKSFNYPLNYGNNYRCRWSIKAPETYYVNLSIIDIDIPSANNATKLSTCVFDYLTILDGYTGKLIGRYCNENIPPAHIVSPWNEFIIQFDTNSDTTGRGFYFQYRFMQITLSEKVKQQLNLPQSAFNYMLNQPSPQQSPINNNSTNSTLINSSSSVNVTTPSDMMVMVNNNNFCPNGWQYYHGNCYKAFKESEPLQWYDAEDKCNNVHGLGLDGHLVSILNKDEMLVILYLLTHAWKSPKYHDYYIGLIDVTREGVYRWSDNNPMSYTDWQLKPLLIEEEFLAQPDGGAYEDCTIIRYNSYSASSNWHDVPCSLGKHFHSITSEITTSQLAYNWQYVNSYICKSDSFATGAFSRTEIRRPLFPAYELSALRAPQQITSTDQSAIGTQQTNQPHSSTDSSSNNLPLENNTTTDDPNRHQQTGHQQSNIGDQSSGGSNNETSFSSSTSSSTSALDSRSMTIARAAHILTRPQDIEFLRKLNSNKYFLCQNLEVISAVLECDGIAQCRDGSDESSECDQDCLAWQFKCANGRCIPIGAYCDFVDDCGDGSDESRCERARCKLNEFKCQSGQCILAQRRCDLLQDCTDASDEGKLCTIGSNCNTGSTFQCYNGNCIPNYTVCDFQIDCPGKFHEDEDLATCELVLKNRTLEYRANYAVMTAANHHQLSWSPTYPHQNFTNLSQMAPLSQLINSDPLVRPAQERFVCASGNSINSSLRCLYEFDQYGYQQGCRDVSHLIDCEHFECPKRDYVKCRNSYCIPWRYICDGKWDCISGDDEVGCARYVCPAQYKCANQSSCILPHQLCDGQRQCPMGDDEWFCDLSCPAQCNCIGQWVSCKNAGLTELPANFVSKSVRKLDLSGNRLGPNLISANFSAYHDLGELILDHNQIELLVPRKFAQLRNLYKLDLSNNQIHSLKRGAFAGLRRVTQLLLESNPDLQFLEPEAFLGLSSLQILNISSSRILTLKKNTFDGLTSLRHLLLQSNMIVEIEDGAFRSLNSLVSLDMRGNEIRHFTKLVFNDLKSLRNLSTDSFKFCCMVNKQIPTDRCLPLPDEISDCEDLLSSPIQRTCIWIAGGVSVVGNLLGIACTWKDRFGQKERKEDRVNSTLLLSLGCSDLLMGIYLIIIAAVDFDYRGIYIENSDNWRESFTCNFCGFLSTISSVVSVFTLVFIALNRFAEICKPFDSPSKFTLGYTHRIISGSWLAALTIATIPLIARSIFKGNFYSKNGVCLAFHITNQKSPGWLYSIIVFQGLNLFAFLVIVRCYTLMYLEISRAPLRQQSGPKPNHQIKILLIILTSFIAWSPTIILRLISLAGIGLPAAVYSWIAVFVLPVNSAINPIIYTAPSIKRFICTFLRIYRSKNARFMARVSQQQQSMASMSSNEANQHSASSYSWRAGKDFRTMLTANGELRKRLGTRNVPPGYLPIKLYIKEASEPLQASQLAQLALDIVRDLEAKHSEGKVYITLDLDVIYVSDCIPSVRANSSSNEDNNSIVVINQHSDENDVYHNVDANANSNRSLSVFIADHDGYRPKNSHRCNHINRPQKPVTDCECADVSRFGDILIRLIQCNNNRRTLGEQSLSE